MKKILLIAICISTGLHAQYTLELIKDLNPGEPNSDPGWFVEINDVVYFPANDGTNGIELWRTDATEAGTSMVKNIGTGASSMCESVYGCGSEHIVMNDILYFRATDNVHGAEIWRSDGTDAGTYMIKDINPGLGDNSNSIFMSAQYFAEMNDVLYFAADGGGNNIELWRSDGTEAGTYLVKDLALGGSSVPEFISAIENNIYFRCKNDDGESELWKSDGTEAGTILLKQMWVTATEYQNMFIAYDGFIYFRGGVGDPYDQELWRTDGTPAGTELFMNINEDDGDGSDPKQFFILNDKLFFVADNGDDDFIFTSDGTVAGTQKLLDENGDDVLPGNYAFLPSENKIYFSATNADFDDGLWVTDGTNAGTKFLSEYGSGAFDASSATVVNGNNIVYSGYDDDNGCTTVFQSNGTVAGTFQLLECDELSYPYSMITYNGMAILNGDADAVGAELWKLETEFEVGLEETIMPSNMNIYPNPAVDQLIISSNNFENAEDIYLINTFGQIVLQTKLISGVQTLNISELVDGVYLVKSKGATEKLIISNR